jgi:hypothetical protein
VSAPKASSVEINGFPCRVWTKGTGPKLGFLAGLGGLPRWLPFLDRLAETRTVIVPSLPGYPGARWVARSPPRWRRSSRATSASSC